MKNYRFAICLLFLAFFFSTYQPVFSLTSKIHISTQSFQTFCRTELYFGRDKNDATEVTEEEWSKFLDEVVTPKFPKGLTVIDAKGQWQNDDGKIVKEKSKVLILLYPTNTRRSSGRKIEQIRNAYKKMFKQESVMRVDSLERVFF